MRYQRDILEWEVVSPGFLSGLLQKRTEKKENLKIFLKKILISIIPFID